MTTILPHEDFVVTDRGGIIENRHRVHAAVVDAHGRLLYVVGDPSRVTLARSAAKPAQALAILRTGAFQECGFDEADLALMCASHNGEERHLDRARNMLAKTQANEDDLRCGGHWSISEAVTHAWIRNAYSPTAISNNCSGKHAGMLSGARALKAGLKDYHLAHHPMQLLVKRTIEELSEADANNINWAIDGCNLPAPALPLKHIARIYAKLADAADATVATDASKHDGSSTSKTTGDLARVYNAMTKYPELVGGEGRFCTTLMEAFQGAIVGKVGADGCYGIAIRASEQTKALGAEGAIGIAFKVEDGNLSVLYAVVMEVLQQLSIRPASMQQELGAFHHLKYLNTFGVETGVLSHTFSVRRMKRESAL
jgi:L-asparaginase II